MKPLTNHSVEFVFYVANLIIWSISLGLVRSFGLSLNELNGISLICFMLRVSIQKTDRPNVSLHQVSGNWVSDNSDRSATDNIWYSMKQNITQSMPFGHACGCLVLDIKPSLYFALLSSFFSFLWLTYYTHCPSLFIISCSVVWFGGVWKSGGLKVNSMWDCQHLNECKREI